MFQPCDYHCFRLQNYEGLYFMAIPKNWYLKWRKYLTSINWRIFKNSVAFVVKLGLGFVLKRKRTQ